MPWTKSTFEIGSYRDGNWLCACDSPTVWRTVQKEGPTKGERFLRCKVNPQCNFFLWEVHEAGARNSLTQSGNPRPTTPPSTDNLGTAFYLPTPSTIGSTAATLPTRDRRLPTLDETPTRRRGKGIVTSPVAADDEDDEDNEGTLLSQIIARLGADGFMLRPSTKESLGHILREEIAIYEAKLRTRDVTIARLCSQLDKLTVNEKVSVKT